MSLPCNVSLQSLSFRAISPEKLSIFDWSVVEKDEDHLRETRRSLEKGIIEPLKIREMPLGSEVWDGEEKITMAKEVGISEVPCISYGKLSDEETRALKFNLALQREEEIDYEKIYAEWLRLLDDEDWTFKEISDLYGVPESEVYSGASEYENQSDDESSSFQQNSLAGWSDEERSESSSAQKTNDSGFQGEAKDLKGARDPILDKKPKEIEIMISGRLDDFLSRDIEGESHSIPSKIVEILNLYYGIE